MTSTTLVSPDTATDLIERLLECDRAIGKSEQLVRDRIIRFHNEWPDKGYRFDLDAGLRVIQFIESYCRHYKGEWAGTPMLLEGWQKVILLETFGWKRADNLRVHRTMWLELGRKNGKSALAAALGLYLLIADDEPGAEVYSSATKRDQARIVFSFAKEMVSQSPELQKFIKIQRTNMSVLRTRSKFEPLSAEGDTLDGLSPHGNIIDELHSHKDRGVYDKLVTAQASRRQPLTVCITTAGIYDPAQIGWQLHDHATSILKGTIEDDSWFVWISEADEEDDPYNVETWQKANPNLGISIYPDFLEQRASEALSQPSSMNAFTRLHLNMWTQQIERWIDMDNWNSCGHEFEIDSLEGRECESVSA